MSPTEIQPCESPQRGEKMKKSPFIGYYDYWVALTYLSILSAVLGVYFAFDGNIKAAIICMMFSGLFDTFDGRVASLKERDNIQLSFGIQIDGMADLISFGVLPATILYSLGQDGGSFGINNALIPAIYVLATFIRLAYFTATETASENTQEERAYFQGLPTTSVALLIPIVYSICYVLQAPMFMAFSVMLAVISVLFVLRVKIPKPRMKMQIALCLIGLGVLIVMQILGGLL